MQGEGRFVVVDGQPLVAESGRNAVGAKQCGQQMALGKTVAGAVPEHVGGDAGNRVHLVIPAMPDLVAYEFETGSGDLFLANFTVGKFTGLGCDLGVLPVDVAARFQIYS